MLYDYSYLYLYIIEDQNVLRRVYPTKTPKQTNNNPQSSTTNTCPPPLLACGDACYDTNLYCCPNGRLTQKPFCSNEDSKSITGTSNSNTGITQASETKSAIITEADPSRTDGSSPSPTSNSQNPNKCPATLSTCLDACYSPTEYCCIDGKLKQIAFCPKENSTQSGGDSSSPSEGLVCADNLVNCHNVSCYNPAHEYCCRDGNTGCFTASSYGCAYNSDGSSYCLSPPASTPGSTASNICAGKCFGQSCCATPTGSSCYNHNSYDCSTDDIGNNLVCMKGLKACGRDCYIPSKYSCKNGQLQSL